MSRPSRRRRVCTLAIAGALIATVGLVAVRLESGAMAAAGWEAQTSTGLAKESPTSGPASGAQPTDAPASVAPTSRAPTSRAPTSNPVVRPATPDGPVPSSLRPSLAAAARDYPQPYLDRCHTQQDGHPSSGTCLYGALKSKTTIVLFGDSHALSWFPAVERVAEREGWRLLNLTMSACSPATMPVWSSNLKNVYTECAKWRAAAIARLVKERPAIVLVAGTRGFSAVDASGTVLVGADRTRAWRAGMALTLDRLTAAAGKVIVIGDTPLSLVDPPVCLAKHPTSVLACATPVARSINEGWLNEERGAAQRAGSGFIDPSLWVCPSSPCPVVIGKFLVFRNPGHLTAAFASTLYVRLGDAILGAVASPPPPPR